MRVNNLASRNTTTEIVAVPNATIIAAIKAASLIGGEKPGGAGLSNSITLVKTMPSPPSAIATVATAKKKAARVFLAGGMTGPLV